MWVLLLNVTSQRADRHWCAAAGEATPGLSHSHVQQPGITSLYHSSAAPCLLHTTALLHHACSASQHFCTTSVLHHISTAPWLLCIMVLLHHAPLHNSSTAPWPLCITTQLHHSSPAAQFHCTMAAHRSDAPHLHHSSSALWQLFALCCNTRAAPQGL